MPLGELRQFPQVIRMEVVEVLNEVVEGKRVDLLPDREGSSNRYGCY